MVLVAVALLALIGSAALVLLAGSVEWQRNQLQELADTTALDAALKIGIGCDAAKVGAVITEADTFLATQRARTGSLTIAPGTCATPYRGTDTFSGGLSASYSYPYQAHQQQVQVVLTLSLPISFGGELGATNTTVTRYAVGEALPASVPAVSAKTLNCTGGQVNVAGDVMAQNAITLSGGCALYSHTRVGGGAYSSLGNVSVYADGQSWVNAGGACVAGLSSGSSNAICADGYELSGHIAPACGGTQYQSAADQAVNPNPCAAGVGRPPVTPFPTTLPPDPNSDAAAIATLQGPGGSACSASGVYPNISAGGNVVGTGLAPAPIKDASGFYHFKPSCYGYLNLATLGAGIANRQIGAETPVQRHFIMPTLPAASQAGTLLVVNVSGVAGITSITGPVGWVQAATATQAGEGRNDTWYYPNNPGGISTVTFTVLPASRDTVAQMSEWSGVATATPLDQTGTLNVAVASTTATIATSGAMTMANELVITNDRYKIGAGQTFTPAAGWPSLVNDATNGFSSEHRLDLPVGIASETVTTSQATRWSLTIATFKPAAGSSGAVLDPGFYYFNGSGFPGGGGMCLNGGTLLARDVTLEFVNQSGFSTGDCTVGGGAVGASPSKFGSAPCSLSTCPPNAAADPPNNLTWFAAPCSTAPSSLDAASCPGSTWCPTGDRACENLLIWAPPTATGQVALTGTAARSWLLGTIDWPGTCTDTVNGTSSIAGAVSCGTLSIQAAGGAGTAIGSDAGINTATVEAILIE